MSDETSEPIKTGKASVEEFMGWERRQPEPTPEPAVFEGSNSVENAANQHTRERNATTEAPLTKPPHPDEGRVALSVEEAASDLANFHKLQRIADEVDNLQNLASEVDLARNLIYNGPQPTDAAAQAQSPEVPQPESAPPEAPEAAGISPKVRELLADPDVQKFVSSEIERIGAAERAYIDATRHNALTATAYALAQYDEFRGLSLEQASQQLAIIERQNPQRFSEIKQGLQAPAAMLEEFAHAQQANLARQQHEHATRMHAFREEQDRRIIQTRPELKDQATARRYMDAAPTYLAERGFSRNDLEALMSGKSGIAIFDARMQDIIIDALTKR